MKEPLDPVARDRARIRALLATAGLAHHEDAVLAASRIALELHPKRVVGSLPKGASRLGGVPDLPAGDTDWPDGMAFVAELNLAEIADLGCDLALPREGLLTFFVLDGEDEDGDYLGTGWVQLDTRAKSVARLRAPRGVKPFPSFGVRYEPRLTIPCPGTSEHRALGLRGAEKTAYNDRVWLELDQPRHQLLGCENTDLDDDPDDALLLGLGSDPRLRWHWGDDNRLNFEIPRKSLARKKLADAFPRYVDA